MSEAMSETEWLDADPAAMLLFLPTQGKDRKLRLFSIACFQTVSPLTGVDDRLAVSVSERFADGEVSARKLHRVRSKVGAMGGYSAKWAASNALSAILNANAFEAAGSAISYTGLFKYHLTRETTPGSDIDPQEAELRARKEAAVLFRDIFGNPFQPVTFDTRWRTSDTLGLARGIYEDRSFDRLPILADALMDAGCEDEQIIAHCRSEGPHVRGCWVVDLVLGKS